MGKLSDALGFGPAPTSMDEGDGDELAPESKPEGGASAELMAMKMFSKASTTEAKVEAMKAFLEACGAIGSDY